MTLGNAVVVFWASPCLSEQVGGPTVSHPVVPTADLEGFLLFPNWSVPYRGRPGRRQSGTLGPHAPAGARLAASSRPHPSRLLQKDTTDRGAKTTDTCSSQFWGLEVRGQGASRVSVW